MNSKATAQLSISQPNSRKAQNQISPLKGVKVLLVEDEPDVAEIITFILTDYGSEVTGVTQACQALETLEFVRFDILMCNIRLPDFDGIWLIRQIRAAKTKEIQQLPAIAITSFTREYSEQTFQSAGFQHYLPKPLDPDEVVTTILRLTGNKGVY